MKKLTLLIALIVAVTIGGVYATWTYTGTSDIVDVDKEVVINMEAATLSGTPGEYTVSTNITAFDITQAGTAGAEFHLATLRVLTDSQNTAPKITITFTPSTGADATMKTKGVETQFYFTTSAPMTYDSDNIFTFGATAATPHKILTVGSTATGHDLVWVPDDVDNPTKFTCEISGEAAILEHIKLTKDFILDTKAKHDVFKAAANANIKLVVNDGTIT